MKAIEINKWMNKRSVLGEWRLHCLWLWANGMCEQPPSVQLKLSLPRWQNIPDECGCVCGWSKVKQERLIFKKKYCQVLNIMVCIYSRWGCPAIRICISGERHLAIRYRISELNTFFFLRSFLAVPRATSRHRVGGLSWPRTTWPPLWILFNEEENKKILQLMLLASTPDQHCSGCQQEVPHPGRSYRNSPVT